MDLLSQFYGVVFLAAGALYAFFYVLPLWRESLALGTSRLKELGKKLQSDRDDFAEIAAKPPPVPEAPPEVSAERILSDWFREWCAKGGEQITKASAFEEALRMVLPGAGVWEIYRLRTQPGEPIAFAESSQEQTSAYWHELASAYWLVEVDGKLFVLPAPLSAQAFVEVSPVYEGGTVAPAALGAIRLARVEDLDADDEDDSRVDYRLEQKGLLSGADAGLAAANAGGAGQRHDALRLSRLPSLRADYGESVVQEAVDQIRAQYPDGAYQRFEVERLPTVAAFSERVGAARTMAGVFVLIGLLFTMIRLNGVVRGIADATNGSGMDQDSFLTEMGRLMTGIGGAFDSSIYGLALLVLALLLVGAIDWVAQRRVLTLERFVVHDLVPTLAELHDQLMPNLSLADLMTETGAQLRTLGSTVGNLSGELDGSLSALGDRIGDMMADFSSFTDQYVRLNDLLTHMRDASTHLKDTTAALKGAAARIVDPFTTFNQTFAQHIETVADAVVATREGIEVSDRNFARLGEQIAAVQVHTERIVERMSETTAGQLGESVEHHRQALAEVQAQTAQLQQSLGRVSDALEKATQVQISGTLQRIDQTVGALGQDRGPQTLFAWTRSGIRRLFRRSGASQ